jgi:hypothetical protein
LAQKHVSSPHSRVETYEHYAHFVDLLFSFQRPKPTSVFLSFEGPFFYFTSLKPSRKIEKNFSAGFQSRPSEFSFRCSASRALYLTTSRPQVNLKNLPIVDFFRGGFAATRAKLYVAALHDEARGDSELARGLTRALGARIIWRAS